MNAADSYYDGITALRREIKQLKFQNKLLNQVIDNHGFCPDCRDKLDSRCWRCYSQRLEDKIAILRGIRNG